MVGANTITLWNTGPAPDVDALELVGGVDDGDPTTSPTPTEPGGHPTEDPWAEDPASAKPASAPEAENRTLIEDYSSEFNGTDVDGLYRNFVDEWGWRSEWRWSDDNVAVADGSLALKQTFEPTSDYNTNVKGWQTAQLDVDLQTRNTDTATTYAAHTGASGLRHTYYNAFGTRTQQTFAALPAGQYEFSAWAQTLGTTGEVALFHSSCSATDSMARVEIPRANGPVGAGLPPDRRQALVHRMRAILTHAAMPHGDLGLEGGTS